MFDYTYNSDGIRTQKKVYSSGGVLESTVNYILDGSKIIAEYSGNNYTYYVYDESGTIMGMMYNNQLYTFRKNLQGDVTGIYTANGDLVVEYTYSPYGEVLSTTGTLASTIGTANPFRYRGYYYDTETGFYYLNSRYYDPVVGRFISADEVMSDVGGDIRGNNLFAYCMNNPVNMDDQDGNWPKWAKKAVRAVSGFVAKATAAVNAPTTAIKITSASTAAVISGQAKVQDVWTDVKNYDFFNDDETKVLNSKVFSSYKGTPVIRHNIPDITSFSISNTIYLNESKVANADGINVVKHEWGHTVQQSIMGTPRYLYKIALPSVIGCALNVNNYYSQPWERSADFFGGVNRGNYTKGAEEGALWYFVLP